MADGKYAEHKLSLSSGRLYNSRDDGRRNVLTGWARSPIQDRMTVWALRELVARLDAIGAPDSATVEADKSDTGRLTSLRVSWEQRLTLAEMIERLVQTEEDEREPDAVDGDESADAAEPASAGAEAEQGAG